MSDEVCSWFKVSPTPESVYACSWTFEEAMETGILLEQEWTESQKTPQSKGNQQQQGQKSWPKKRSFQQNSGGKKSAPASKEEPQQQPTATESLAPAAAETGGGSIELPKMSDGSSWPTVSTGPRRMYLLWQDGPLHQGLSKEAVR